MRRVRLSHIGSTHHIVSRGLRGEAIFSDDVAKAYFLDSLAEKSRALQIRILAYCLMDNHYHLVLHNLSGKLSEFMKQLNGQYGMYYRKKYGGSGYVFQGRFKSTLIQNDVYLKMAIIYVLLNPVRGGIVKLPWEYRWSSIHEYFAGAKSFIIDTDYVEALFLTRDDLTKLLLEWTAESLPVIQTRLGDVLGDQKFKAEAITLFDRRKKRATSRKMRREEPQFRSVQEIMQAFENAHGLKTADINIHGRRGQTLRAELLVTLKDEAGLTYADIIQLPLFQSLKYSSLGQLYKRAKKGTKRVK